ncbi:cytochrome c [Novosphingobium sp. 9U]|uniref:c-type cytochrome n=1 Tax=Novosphingobium sp. 9U TaxID=2653158 RepID=UPI0012F18726|nr:cytochrome c [Novosphingobium sp. 9U]VWX47355.1 putative ABC-type Fe3+ transport system protein; Molybdenum transport protein [Novosphingobium sp. 9U]
MRLLALLPLVLLAACGDNMVQQARYDSYEKAPLFADGMAMQAPPAGVVSRDAPQRAAETRRLPMSLALIERGRERYGIYCVPCHAQDGSGNGVVPSRGFPHPPDFHSDRLKAAPDTHFYQVMTNGYGIMYSYADRVSPPDRWAIVAYIRALQATGLPPRRQEPARAY